MRAALRAVLLRGTSTGLDLNFAGGAFSLNNTRTDNPAAIPGWSFSRTDTNGTATALDLAGNVIQFATGVPRITNRGILVEEARTNLLLNSAFAGGGAAPTSWTQPVATGTSAPVTSTITTAATAYQQSGTAQRPYLTQQVTVAVGTYTVSVYVESVTGSVTAEQMISYGGGTATVSGVAHPACPANPSGGNTSLINAGLLLFSITVTGAGTLSPRVGLGVNAGGATGTVRFSLPQTEQGSFATSPIITTGAAGTRDGEVVSLGTAALPAEGTIILTYVVQPTAVGTAARTYGFNLTDAGNSRFSLRIGDSGSATTPVAIIGDGAALTTLTGSSLTPGTTAKVAVSYSSLSAQFAMAVNGSDQTGARQAVAATLALTFRLGSIGTPGTNAINSPIARLQIIPRFLSAAERIALTAP
jgi:hypothetical protein